MARSAAAKVTPIGKGPEKALEAEAKARKAAAKPDEPKPETDAEKIARLEGELAQARRDALILVGTCEQAKADMTKIQAFIDHKLGR